jgi:hypothetical protein
MVEGRVDRTESVAVVMIVIRGNTPNLLAS